ncbi:hypothetical protein [Clostridium algidicarnis]|uniref:Uncharacterized protein n=1 Tax=Clostridium algidicarnis DSM 15099 TaxID=1121295 RepID=A0A2S6FYQ9_9CLOT|nr:hypothetical protein [Clostridium algidicarnis]PPK48615.1 hypothetical protein BD821_106137 [Clostridium algidicarnis DSM 15099]
MNDKIVIHELKELNLMEALKLWRISFNAGIGRRKEQRSLEKLKEVGITTGFLFINVNNPGSEDFWNSMGWTVIQDIKCILLYFLVLCVH